VASLSKSNKSKKGGKGMFSFDFGGIEEAKEREDEESAQAMVGKFRKESRDMDDLSVDIDLNQIQC